MAASVRSKLKLGISECRCVASPAPAPARAFVPARSSQVSLGSYVVVFSWNLCTYVSDFFVTLHEFMSEYVSCQEIITNPCLVRHYTYIP